MGLMRSSKTELVREAGLADLLSGSEASKAAQTFWLLMTFLWWCLRKKKERNMIVGDERDLQNLVRHE